ncbi:MAG: AI-2E family transporter, partial [Chloroflexota bacterium]
LFIGVSTGIGLALVGVEQWLALGVLAGLLSFVPNFGMVLTLVPAVAVTIVQVPKAVFVVVAIIVIVSFLQAQIIGPYLTSETMNLPPVLILIGQIILGVFFGFLGLMLAVPLTAIVLVQEIYIKDILGDELSIAKNVE